MPRSWCLALDFCAGVLLAHGCRADFSSQSRHECAKLPCRTGTANKEELGYENARTEEQEQSRAGDLLFFSADIDSRMQRQMIRSDSSKRCNAAAHADQRSLRFNPDSIEGENWRTRRESP